MSQQALHAEAGWATNAGVFVGTCEVSLRIKSFTHFLFKGRAWLGMLDWDCTSSSLYHAPVSEPELLSEIRWTSRLMRRSGSSAGAVVPFIGP